MTRCLQCGVIAKHMYEVVRRTDPDERVELVCYDCRESLANAAEDAEAEGSCGYAETCSGRATYVALEQRTVTTDSGDVKVVTETADLLCDEHFERLTAEKP